MLRIPQANLLSRLRWLLLLPIPLIWCLVEQYHWLAVLENKSIDWRFQFRDELASPVKIAYVDIDTVSLGEVGGWPWNRSYFATVTAALINEGKAKAVGFDVLFSDEGIAEYADRKYVVMGNQEFGQYLMKQPPVALPASYSGTTFIDVNGKVRERRLPIVASKLLDPGEPPQVPAFETSPDPDKRRPWTPPVAIGIIDTLNNGTRIVPAWAPNNTKINYYHMAAQLARLYWGLPREALRYREGALEFVRGDGSLLRRVPLIDEQFLEINWFTRWQSPSTPHWHFSDVYKLAAALTSKDPEEVALGKEFFAQDEFKDAVVLIGPVDPFFQDLAPTSLDDGPVPKVGVHANLLKTIVSGEFLRRLTSQQNYAIICGLTLVVTVLSLAGGARALFAKIMAVLAVGIYVALVFQVFKNSHLVLPFTSPLGAAFTTAFAGLIWQVIDEQKAKGRIKGMFSAYLAPTVVNTLIDSGKEPELGGHEEQITAYFSDIQSFSTFSEKMTPARLVELMNEYLTVCTDIVQEEGGTLDKYIGDAVVAMFGAPLPLPDHAYRACFATVRVQVGIEELRKKWRSEGEAWPQVVHNLRARLGLNTGSAIIGNMGSRTRFSYTMMGDNVNLAARMESGAKSIGVYTMITDSTRTECEKHMVGKKEIVFRFLDKLVVKGRSLPVPVHEVVGFKEDIGQEMFDCLGVHAKAMERYLAQDWDGAIKLFEQSSLLEIHKPDPALAIESNPSLKMIKRCHYMKEHPPGPNWTGVYEMTEK